MTNEDLIDGCIKRVTILKKDNKPELSAVAIKRTETKLNVLLSNDFKILNKFYGYDFFSSFDFYNFENVEGVIDETMYYRKNYNLPDNYLVLFSDDVSFVLLKTISESQSEVIWCDYPDFFNLCAGKPFKYNITFFPTFTDFYAFLLDEEEKQRAEEE